MYSAVLSQDYKIEKVVSGKDCISKFREIQNSFQSVIVLLLDFKLGDMNGDELARQLSRIGEAKIILMSSFDLDINMIKELKDDNIITDFLPKPIKISILRKKIADCLL